MHSPTRFTFEVDPDKKTICVVTAYGGAVIFSEADGSVTLVDASRGQQVKLSAGGIAITTEGDLTIQAKGSITLSGLNVSLQAAVAAKVSGNASAELSAAGQTTVKGALVMIN